MPRVPPGGPVAAGVTDQWGGMSEGSAVLWLASGEHFNGNDACNTLTGTCGWSTGSTSS